MTPGNRHNLLDDPTFGVEDSAGERSRSTLPGLLARLSGGDSTTLTALQAHQQPPMHAFLVQLAAMALARAGESTPPDDEPRWRSLLLDCAKADGAGVEAFTLIVGDLSKPAFLQAPVPEGTLAALKNEHDRPSGELDVLITAKNHDVKIDRVAHPGLEHWVFALLALQTMQGFLGAGNYGIARMNGGFASRPLIGFAPEPSAAGRFRRDVRVLLERRSEIEERFGFGQRGHLGLVWCAPWDGARSLSFSELDPFFIEICRRVRLTRAADGSIVAHRGATKASRIDAKDAAGNTGDPWTPVNHESGAALSVPEAGFTYQRVRDLLFQEEWRAGVAGELRADGTDDLWVGQVLSRGQGKTGGYHERWLPVPSTVRVLLSRPDSRSLLAVRSKAWVGRAKEARLNVLRPALLALLQGGPDKLKLDDDRAELYLRRLDAAIDQDFFRLLFEHADEPPEIADVAFDARLFEVARDQLEEAKRSLPVPNARRWRAEAHADRVLYGAARKRLNLTSRTPGAGAAAPEGDSP